jgi:hypothetical protein
MPVRWRYGLSAQLWCACADYIESGDAIQLLLAAANAPLTAIIPVAIAHVFPPAGASPDAERRSSDLLASLARLTLLLVCPLELPDLHREIARRWTRDAGRAPPLSASLANFKDENLWNPYNTEAATWFSDHEQEIKKVFSDWLKANGAPDQNSHFDALIDSMCAIKGRPRSPRPGG